MPMKSLGRGRPLVVRPIKNHSCVCPLLDVVKFLVMSDGLDTTLTNVDGETAKDIANRNGFHDIANLL